jgi:hypothetical protein
MLNCGMGEMCSLEFLIFDFLLIVKDVTNWYKLMFSKFCSHQTSGINV